MTSNQNLDREVLLERARVGDTAAMGALFELCRPYLTLLARLSVGRRLQGKADPADVVQDTFLEAARQFPHFRGTSEPELAAWLRQILAGCLATLARRYRGTQARDVQRERALADLGTSSRELDGNLFARESTPSQRASRREQAVLLADALEQLPPDYREVLILRSLEGLTFPEVAARMGRSPVAVERLWARALPHLKRALEAGQ
jgi:RNA polymerase sigma-70 factor (ECF subfamily)